jgi:hypothetical protein
MTEAQAAALAWHIERGDSPALVSVHAGGFLAGVNGAPASSSPWWKKNPGRQDGSQWAHEWEVARQAGRSFATGKLF